MISIIRYLREPATWAGFGIIATQAGDIPAWVALVAGGLAVLLPETGRQ